MSPSFCDQTERWPIISKENLINNNIYESKIIRFDDDDRLISPNVSDF